MINQKAIECLQCPVSKGLGEELSRLKDAAEEVLRTYMPHFNDSRVVDDCLVGLAAAVAGIDPSQSAKGGVT